MIACVGGKVNVRGDEKSPSRENADEKVKEKKEVWLYMGDGMLYTKCPSAPLGDVNFWEWCVACEAYSHCFPGETPSEVYARAKRIE